MWNKPNPLRTDEKHIRPLKVQQTSSKTADADEASCAKIRQNDVVNRGPLQNMIDSGAFQLPRASKNSLAGCSVGASLLN